MTYPSVCLLVLDLLSFFIIDVVSRPVEAATVLVCEETVVPKSGPTEETEDDPGTSDVSYASLGF